MEFHLVDHGFDFRNHQRLQMVGQEVAHPDGARLSCFVKVGHGPPGFQIDLLPVGKLFGVGRPVDQVQIQVIQPQCLQGLVTGGQGGPIAPVCVPHLAGDKHLLPGQAPVSHRPAHAVLVAVTGGGVHMAVAKIQGQMHRRIGAAPFRDLPGAKAKGGNFHTVCQGKVPFLHSFTLSSPASPPPPAAAG